MADGSLDGGTGAVRVVMPMIGAVMDIPSNGIYAHSIMLNIGLNQKSAFLRSLFSHSTLIKLLLQAGGLAGSTSQEVQLGAAGLGMALHHNLVNSGRAQQERALYTNTIGCNTAHGKSASHTAVADADNGAFEFLDTLAFTFFNSDMNGNRIARTQIRDIGVGGSLNGLQQVGHFLYILTRM